MAVAPEPHTARQSITAPPVRHLVWDWNGTLLDDADAMIQSTIDAFAAMQLPPLTVERYRQLHTQPIEVFYSRLLDRPVSTELSDRIRTAYREAYIRRRPTLSLAPEAVGALERVASLGISQSLLSMHPHDPLIPLLDGFGISAHFTRIDGQRGPDAGYKSGHLAHHLELLGIPGRATLLIGDSVDDARAARAAGARCVLYASGLHTTEDLEKEEVPVVSSLPAALTAGLGRSDVT